MSERNPFDADFDSFFDVIQQKVVDEEQRTVRRLQEKLTERMSIFNIHR